VSGLIAQPEVRRMLDLVGGRTSCAAWPFSVCMRQITRGTVQRVPRSSGRPLLTMPRDPRSLSLWLSDVPTVARDPCSPSPWPPDVPTITRNLCSLSLRPPDGPTMTRNPFIKAAYVCRTPSQSLHTLTDAVVYVPPV